MSRSISVNGIPSTIMYNGKALELSKEFSRPELQKYTPDPKEKSFHDILKSGQPTQEQESAYRNTKAHTVFRSGSNIVAVQWSDGVTEIRDQKAVNLGLIQDSDSPEERVRKLKKAFNSSVVAESYSGRANAPTRSTLDRIR